MDRAAWNFVSGYVSALADRLMDQRTVMAVAQASTGEEIRSRLRASLLFSATPPGERPLDEVEQRFREMAHAVGALCPDPGVAEMFLLPHEWHAFRQMGRARLTKKAAGGLRGESGDAEGFEAALRGDMGGVRALGFAQAGVRLAVEATGEAEPSVVDRVSDPWEAACAVLAAQGLGSEELSRWAETWAGFRAALSLIRARLNGWEIEPYYEEWRAAGFTAEALNDIAFGAPSEWPSALGRLGLPGAGEALSGAAPAVRLARRMDDRITELSRGASGVAFGPEKVFAFLWALKMEALNLRLMLSSVEAGIPPERVTDELRMEHG